MARLFFWKIILNKKSYKKIFLNKYFNRNEPNKYIVFQKLNYYKYIFFIFLSKKFIEI